MWGVLTSDVDTQWGTFAHGLPVEIIDSDSRTRVVVLSAIGERRYTARVPRRGVLVGVVE